MREFNIPFHHDEFEHHHHGRGFAEGPDMRGGGRGRGRGGFGGHFGGPFGGPGGFSPRRGESRYILLDALRDGPKHGYEIIKALEERSGGQYAPSPGTVYPTLQHLQELGLLHEEPDGERRIYSLTDAGHKELEEHAQEVAVFWSRMTSPGPAQRVEMSFLEEDMEQLFRTVVSGARSIRDSDDVDTIQAIRAAIEVCQKEVRRIIAGNSR